MNKLLVLGGVLAGAALLWYMFLYNPCEEPQPLQVSVVALNCAMEFFNRPLEEVRADACKFLGRDPGCGFSEEDKIKVLDMIDQKVLVCTKKRLAADGWCTDKITKEGLLQ